MTVILKQMDKVEKDFKNILELIIKKKFGKKRLFIKIR